MKNVFFFIALLIMITSCNLQKHVTRNEVNTSLQTESKEEMASRLKKETEKDIRGSKDTHTTENCDTNFKTPGSSITGEKSLRDLLNGGSFDLENSAVKGTVRIDSATGKVKVILDEKPRSFPGKFNRTTDIHETTSEQSKVNEDLHSSGSVKSSTTSSTKTTKLIKNVQSSVSWWPWIIWALLAAVIVFVAIKVRKRLL